MTKTGWGEPKIFDPITFLRTSFVESYRIQPKFGGHFSSYNFKRNRKINDAPTGLTGTAAYSAISITAEQGDGRCSRNITNRLLKRSF